MALTINTPLTLPNGLQVAPGAYVRITEDYSNVDATGTVVRFQTFINEDARRSEPMKAPIQAEELPLELGQDVQITQEEWEAAPKHAVLYGKLKAAFEAELGAGSVVNS